MFGRVRRALMRRMMNFRGAAKPSEVVQRAESSKNTHLVDRFREVSGREYDIREPSGLRVCIGRNASHGVVQMTDDFSVYRAEMTKNAASPCDMRPTNRRRDVPPTRPPGESAELLQHASERLRLYVHGVARLADLVGVAERRPDLRPARPEIPARRRLAMIADPIPISTVEGVDVPLGEPLGE